MDSVLITKMASTKFKSGQIDESKFEDAKYMEKLKVWSERVGLTIEEIKEKKITKNQLKKMFKQQVGFELDDR